MFALVVRSCVPVGRDVVHVPGVLSEGDDIALVVHPTFGDAVVAVLILARRIGVDLVAQDVLGHDRNPPPRVASGRETPHGTAPVARECGEQLDLGHGNAFRHRD